jgi:hypothetical protein
VSCPQVYLIHFAWPIGNLDSRYGQASHYLGTALDGDVSRRVAVHRAGYGARIMAAVSAAGVPVFVVRTWDGGRALERSLKRQKNSPRLCPMCQPVPWERPEPEPADELEQAADAAAELALERVLEDAHVEGWLA